MFSAHHGRRALASLFIILLASLAIPLGAIGDTAPPIPIVVTIPVLKDLTEQVGGPHVRVTSLLSGYENEHTYAPKPTDLIAVRKARLLFEIGVGLEIWVSSLVKNAGSASLRVITTSRGVELIRDHADHNHDSDSHQNSTVREPAGNPHIWMDPENVTIMLRHITDALIELDPAHAADFRTNQAAYLRQLEDLKQTLSARVKPLPNRRFIAHHPAWPYLAKRFGFEIAGTIQIQSGSEPSALHVQSLIKQIKKQHVPLIVSEIQLSQRLPELLAHETKARVVVLTTLPGGMPGTETYLDMLRYNVLQLVHALEAA